MMILFYLSAFITACLIAGGAIFVFGSENSLEARLQEVAAHETVQAPDLTGGSQSGLARGAAGITSFLKPIRDMITNSDELPYRLALAGYRRPEHIEIFTAGKMLLPVVGIVLGTFARGNMFTAILVGLVLGFLGPDLALTHLIKRRQESIRLALPDALDLLVICMEAGLGIDQALVRVGDEIVLTSPALADEFRIISREQRAGKVRLEAWRSMNERVDLEPVRQFVSMLVQTERFGTPIAHALGQFADSLRLRRTQAAEEAAAKTGIKLLFPLVVCIFPSIFVVTLGPAILNIQKAFDGFLK
jgi:tight adherence protein C